MITFCPKLDHDLTAISINGTDICASYDQKRNHSPKEVPCCGGTEMIVQKALEKANKMHFVKVNIVSVDGNKI